MTSTVKTVCGRKARTTGEPCQNAPMAGLSVCRMHGGAAPQTRAKSELHKAAVESGMRSYVTPIPAEDWEASPINAFEMEFRRTIGRIRFLDDKLAELKVEDLGWGVTKQEDVTAAEFGGVNITREAKINIYEALQFREREHLVKLETIWIAAKLDSRRLAITRDLMDRLEAKITNVLVALGHRAEDPAVRDVVRRELQGEQA